MKTEINEKDRVVTTVFDDGCQLRAVPNYDKESIARAIALGYIAADMQGVKLPAINEALWRMTKDHECIHSLLAQAERKTHSIALWYAAHPEFEMTDEGRALAHREECSVMFVQRLLNIGVGALIDEFNQGET